MDPNANLDEQCALADSLGKRLDEILRDGNCQDWPQLQAFVADVGRLTELIDGLNHWLTFGGFLPDHWLPAVKASNRKAYEEGRRQGIERLAAATKKVLDPESLASLIAALSRKDEQR